MLGKFQFVRRNWDGWHYEHYKNKLTHSCKVRRQISLKPFCLYFIIWPLWTRWYWMIDDDMETGGSFADSIICFNMFDAKNASSILKKHLLLLWDLENLFAFSGVLKTHLQCLVKLISRLIFFIEMKTCIMFWIF